MLITKSFYRFIPVIITMQYRVYSRSLYRVNLLAVSSLWQWSWLELHYTCVDLEEGLGFIKFPKIGLGPTWITKLSLSIPPTPHPRKIFWIRACHRTLSGFINGFVSAYCIITGKMSFFLFTSFCKCFWTCI